MGRSGSTLLDMLLATSEKAFSLGEICRYNNVRAYKGLCSCNNVFNECPFWGQFKGDKGDFQIINRVNIKDYISIIIFLCNPFKNQMEFQKKSENERLLSSVWSELKDRSFEFLIDSSKDVGRLIELNQNPDVDLYNILITRKGASVANSFTQKYQGQEKNYFFSLFKWIVANTLIRAYIKKSGLKTLYISHAQLCKSPDDTLKKIEEFAGIRIPKDYTQKIRIMPNYHNMGGNRIRRKDFREKFDGIVENEMGERKQNPLESFIGTLIARPFDKWWNV